MIGRSRIGNRAQRKSQLEADVPCGFSDASVSHAMGISNGVDGLAGKCRETSPAVGQSRDQLSVVELRKWMMLPGVESNREPGADQLCRVRASQHVAWIIGTRKA